MGRAKPAVWSDRIATSRPRRCASATMAFLIGGWRLAVQPRAPDHTEPIVSTRTTPLRLDAIRSDHGPAELVVPDLSAGLCELPQVRASRRQARVHWPTDGQAISDLDQAERRCRTDGHESCGGPRRSRSRARGLPSTVRGRETILKRWVARTSPRRDRRQQVHATINEFTFRLQRRRTSTGSQACCSTACLKQARPVCSHASFGDSPRFVTGA